MIDNTNASMHYRYVNPKFNPPVLSPSLSQEYQNREEDTSKLWKVAFFMQRQNRKNGFLILLLGIALSLYLSFSLYHENFSLRLFKNFQVCSQSRDFLERRHHHSKNDLHRLFKYQLWRHKTLTRLYGDFFSLPEQTVIKAIEDEKLWKSIKSILETDSNFGQWEYYVIGPRTETEKKVDNSISIDVNWRIINIQQSQNTAQQGFQQLLETPRKRASHDVLKVPEEIDDKKRSKLSKLKDTFKELTGESADSYLLRRLSSSKEKNNLNLFKYFQHELHDMDLSNLRRSQEMIVNFSDKSIRVTDDHKYVLYDKLIDGKNFFPLSKSNKLTVTTQCSLDRLHSFVESYVYWNGPISVAVFLQEPMDYFIFRSYLSFLKRCHKNQFDRTRFNVATPVSNPIPVDVSIQSKDFDNLLCSSDSSIISRILKQKPSFKSKSWYRSKWYPQNTMRNLARTNIHTDYQITLDIDIMACPKMSEKLEDFLNTSRVYKNALVIPTYEVSKKADFPRNKRELVALTKQGLAQPFHKNIYLPNQNATNFPKWEKIYDSFKPVHVVHIVHQFPVHYEPFFVELNSSPQYDEGFVGYGFTRSSHAYEMFRRNGDFFILSPVYTIQIGILKVKEWSEERKRQNEYNRHRFELFLKTVDQQSASSLANDS